MIIRTSHNAGIAVTERRGCLGTIKKIAKASLGSLNERFNVMLARPRGPDIKALKLYHHQMVGLVKGRELFSYRHFSRWQIAGLNVRLNHFHCSLFFCSIDCPALQLIFGGRGSP
jgi:hypothetical protein